MNKASQLEVMVTVAGAGEDGQLRDTRHYTTLDIERTNAETIKNSFLDSFVDKNVNFQDKLISVGTDGCNTMIGSQNGVIQKLKEEVPELQETGQCNAHNLSNTMQYAVQNFDPDLKLACVNVYQDLGGATGFGLKKVKEFQESCKSIGFKPKPFKQFVTVRFRTLRNCLDPILHNFNALVHYYSNLKKPTERQKLLIEYFVDRQHMSKLKMMFVYSATAEMTEGIDFLESRSVNIHNAADKLENILYTHQMRVLDESEVNVYSEDRDSMERKDRLDLLKVDVETAKLLKNKKMFIGDEAEKYLRKLGLRPDSKQVEWFFESVRRFHKSAILRMQKYFKTALQSSVMANLSALSPSRQSKILTSRQLQSLAKTYSKVVRNIDIDGMDRINTEIEEYVTDEDVKEIDKSLPFGEYWRKVGSLTDGSWKRYNILPAFANALSVIFYSNSEVERTFSIMNNIHQNKQRNCLAQNTLNATLHIRSGVESSLVREDCKKCEVAATPHCHCSLVDLSGDIREKCKLAHSRYSASLDEAKSRKEDETEESKKRNVAFVDKEKLKFDKFKESLSKRPAFYKSELFEPVFKDRKDNKRKQTDQVQENPSKKVNNNVKSNKVTPKRK